MSIKEHESEVTESLKHHKFYVDIVINVQGDEPFINAEPLKK
jgi:3-deoxy-manno-octulosonate cytidylyltransferase (CMP-KDO synthetase)